MIIFELSFGSLGRSGGEGHEEVLEPRNFGYVWILLPIKQTRISQVKLVLPCVGMYRSFESRVIEAYVFEECQT